MRQGNRDRPQGYGQDGRPGQGARGQQSQDPSYQGDRGWQDSERDGGWSQSAGGGENGDQPWNDGQTSGGYDDAPWAGRNPGGFPGGFPGGRQENGGRQWGRPRQLGGGYQDDLESYRGGQGFGSSFGSGYGSDSGSSGGQRGAGSWPQGRSGPSWSSSGGGMGSQTGSQSQESYAGRGPKGYKRSDERVREDASDRLEQDHQVDATEISIEVSSGELTLSGTVTSREQKRAAEECVESVPGVKDVINNLRVSRESSMSAGQSGGSSTQSGRSGQQGKDADSSSGSGKDSNRSKGTTSGASGGAS